MFSKILLLALSFLGTYTGASEPAQANKDTVFVDSPLFHSNKDAYHFFQFPSFESCKRFLEYMEINKEHFTAFTRRSVIKFFDNNEQAYNYLVRYNICMNRQFQRQLIGIETFIAKNINHMYESTDGQSKGGLAGSYSKIKRELIINLKNIDESVQLRNYIRSNEDVFYEFDISVEATEIGFLCFKEDHYWVNFEYYDCEEAENQIKMINEFIAGIRS